MCKNVETVLAKGPHNQLCHRAIVRAIVPD